MIINLLLFFQGFKQPALTSAATAQSMTQEDVFSVLGFSVDCDASNTDKSSTSVIPENEVLDNAATSEQNCAESESSNQADTMVEKQVNGTSSSEICEGSDVTDSKKSTLNSAVDDLTDNKAASEMEEESGEKDNMLAKKTSEVPVTSLEASNEQLNHKDGCDDGPEEVVLLDDDTEDNREGLKTDTESKIGKIFIRKIEDLCEKEAGKEKKGSKSTEENLEKEMSTDTSEEGKCLLYFHHYTFMCMTVVILY